MTDIYKQLKKMEKAVKDAGYVIDHYEVSGDAQPSGRVIGRDPTQTTIRWQEVDDDLRRSYRAEAFIRRPDEMQPFDRLVYSSSEDDYNYVGFLKTGTDEEEIQEIIDRLEE